MHMHAAVTPKRGPVCHSSPQSPAPPLHSHYWSSRLNVADFDHEELFTFIRDNNKVDMEVAVVLRDQHVSGKMFLELSEKDIMDLFPKLGQRKQVEKLLEECQCQAVAVSCSCLVPCIT